MLQCFLLHFNEDRNCFDDLGEVRMELLGSSLLRPSPALRLNLLARLRTAVLTPGNVDLRGQPLVFL